MKIFRSGRVAAIIEALLATFIWASSFVFVKMILPNIGPLTIAGLRYFLAFLVMLPFMMRSKQALQSIAPRTWFHLALIGLCAYCVGNGALFWGLKYLPATTTSFLMGVSPLLILFGGLIFLNEVPSRLQVVGVIISLVGNAVFFSSGLQPGEPLGIAIVAVGLLGFTAFGILGRGLARENRIHTIHLTGIPLGIGGGILLLFAVPMEGWPIFDQKVLLIILWLAIINTAVAYFLYNHALKTITALEMNVFLNLSPLGTAALAWLLLGESLTGKKLLGIAIAIIGVTLVQVKQADPKENDHAIESSIGKGVAG
ncbi:MAG: DMT family transporter [Anaerolineaceae bacterium]|nr:DMT family transporter [Anaerolineaceae bacterium]